MLKIKKAYISFIEKDKKNPLEIAIYSFLYILSLIYGLAMFLRNFLFDRGVLSVYCIDSKVISVGNISWGGCGKTSLVDYLHKRLSCNFKVASVTKGYAPDEFLLLRSKLTNVFDSKDRVSLLKKETEAFDVFILDDGFQHRKIKRDLDIVVMGKKEFERPIRLLPAYIFREPLSSLKRADIVILNYWQKISNLDTIKERLLKINPKLKIYLAEYKYRGFLDKERRSVDFNYFSRRECAALTAIGYPEGFTDILEELGVKINKIMAYPDHYEFEVGEVLRIEEELKKEGIKDVIITYKDFYHIDLTQSSLNYFILDVDLEIKGEDSILEYIKATLEQ